MKTLLWISHGKFTSENKKLIFIDKPWNIYFFTGQDWTFGWWIIFAFYKCQQWQLISKCSFVYLHKSSKLHVQVCSKMLIMLSTISQSHHLEIIPCHKEVHKSKALEIWIRSEAMGSTFISEILQRMFPLELDLKTSFFPGKIAQSKCPKSKCSKRWKHYLSIVSACL